MLIENGATIDYLNLNPGNAMFNIIPDAAIIALAHHLPKEVQEILKTMNTEVNSGIFVDDN